MDETLTRVAIDASNRPYLIWKVAFSRPKLGEMDTELFKEWFQAFAISAGVTLHVENLYGENNHHIAESVLQGLARALREAVEIDPRRRRPSPPPRASSRGMPMETSRSSTTGRAICARPQRRSSAPRRRAELASEIQVTGGRTRWPAPTGSCCPGSARLPTACAVLLRAPGVEAA